MYTASLLLCQTKSEPGALVRGGDKAAGFFIRLPRVGFTVREGQQAKTCSNIERGGSYLSVWFPFVVTGRGGVSVPEEGTRCFFI